LRVVERLRRKPVFGFENEAGPYSKKSKMRPKF
jgi:hypothetical protein